MAKKKEKVVDLKPTSITEDQLKSIQEVVSNINKIHMETGRLEAQKHVAMHSLSDQQNKLTEIQTELQKEYGTVNININSGEINYDDVETNKKN